MNITFNQRYQSTEEKIEKALFTLLGVRKYDDISIKELCYEAGINRSSFYAHYQDINDLMMKTEKRLSQEIEKIFKPNEEWTETVFAKLFQFLYDNRMFYKSYLETSNQPFMEKNDFISYANKLSSFENFSEYKNEEIIYHMAFFAGGIKALTKSWLSSGCKETPEQMARILTNEYRINAKHF